MNSNKIIYFSVIKILLSILVLFILNILISFFINNFLLMMLNWIDNLGLFIKIIILLFGFFLAFVYFLDYVSKVAIFIGDKIFDRFPDNDFSDLVVSMLAFINIIWLIICLWKVPNTFNFWNVCVLIIFSVYTWEINSMIIPRREK